MNQNVVYRQATPLRYLGACQGIPETFIRFRVFQQCTLHLQKSILIGLCCLLYLCFSITKSQEINCLLYF